MMLTEKQARIAEYLEELYSLHQRPELISPDPLQFVTFDDPADREIAALISSSLAYGRVAIILKSVSAVLAALGSSPRAAVESGSLAQWQETFKDFKHRFTDGNDVAHLLTGVQGVIRKYGSMENCLCSYRSSAGSLIAGLEGLVSEIGGGRNNSLLTLPSKGSACKRHFLMLRWLVRHDAVDPGGWDKVSPSELVIPLDVHMYQVCSSIGFTRRKAADLKTAREITSVFALMRPDDPVRYDFVLTRFGIRPDMEQDDVIDGVKKAERKA